MINMKLKTTLFDYQQKAVDKLSKIKVGALYMEMGTGKTRTAMELVKLRFDRRKINRVLWLCPCSVKTNLKRDLLKHSSDFLNYTLILGIESISQSDKT